MKTELEIKHSEMVAALAKNPHTILREILPAEMNLLHAAVGVCGEAGELLDAIKRVAIYKKMVDRPNVVEELGDLEFYIEMVRKALNITREETLEANIIKLAQRYPNYKYTNSDANERKDKPTG